MNATTFSDLPLCSPVQRAVESSGYTHPTPIQAAAIPHLLAGRDLLGCAQTGTGKTAAFALPILHFLHTQRRPAAPHAPQVLVLSPTRELAGQIGDSFKTYGRHTRVRHSVVFGGVSQNPQVRALARGVHVLVATPGRLLDLVGQRKLRLDRVGVLVLDEADRMLDMGFLPDLRRIVAELPSERQSLFFSATMPPKVAELAGNLLTNPVQVAVAPESTTAELVEQRVVFTTSTQKRTLLHGLLEDPQWRQVLVFTRTKRRADTVAKQLRSGGVPADAIHGDKSQNARTRALHGFRNGRSRVLVATDVAARGLDVDGISHVVNYDLPNEPESYVHRIGRTGRAGASGIAVSFCDSSEQQHLRSIERLIGQSIPSEGERPARSHSDQGASKRPKHSKRFPRRKPARAGASKEGGFKSGWRSRSRKRVK